MRRFIIGYGKFSGYALSEVSDECLSELAARFPLRAQPYDARDGETLLITVAVHEEGARRANGGRRQKHIPTVREFTSEIVKAGFRQLSLVHHPDQNGDNESQRRLIEARDILAHSCENIEDDYAHGCTVISAPRSEAAAMPFSGGISDDYVPF